MTEGLPSIRPLSLRPGDHMAMLAERLLTVTR